MDIITTPAVIAAPGADSVLQTAAVYMDSRGVPPVVHLTQYDQTMPVVAVNTYYRSQPYKFPEGAAVNIRMFKPDGKHVYNPALGLSEDRLTAYIAVTGQMTAAAGEGQAVVEVAKADSIAATAPIVFHIHRNPVPEDAYESADEYKTLLELVEDAATSAEAAEKSNQKAGEHETAAEKAQTEAENARDTAAQKAAEGYKDAAAGSAADAKKDADRADDAAARAQSIAQGAKGYYSTPEVLNEAHPTGSDGDWAIIGSTDTIWIWDSNTQVWTDSGNKTDLSQYYTKDETDGKLAGKLDTTGKAPTASIADKVANALTFTGGNNQIYDGGVPISVKIPNTPADVGALAADGKAVSAVSADTAGVCTGNAATATTANHVANALTFIGGATVAYDGSKAISVKIPNTPTDVGALAADGKAVTAGTADTAGKLTPPAPVLLATLTSDGVDVTMAQPYTNFRYLVAVSEFHYSDLAKTGLMYTYFPVPLIQLNKQIVLINLTHTLYSGGAYCLMKAIRFTSSTQVRWDDGGISNTYGLNKTEIYGMQ